MDQSFRHIAFRCPVGQRREGFWPKASVTVAWGNAPGNRGEKLHLAEGHIQFDHARFEYGLQPTGLKLLPIPGAVPQATVKYGRWPITKSFTALPVLCGPLRLRVLCV